MATKQGKWKIGLKKNRKHDNSKYVYSLKKIMVSVRDFCGDRQTTGSLEKTACNLQP